MLLLQNLSWLPLLLKVKGILAFNAFRGLTLLERPASSPLLPQSSLPCKCTSGHFGNLTLLPSSASLTGRPFAQVACPLGHLLSPSCSPPGPFLVLSYRKTSAITPEALLSLRLNTAFWLLHCLLSLLNRQYPCQNRIVLTIVSQQPFTVIDT